MAGARGEGAGGAQMLVTMSMMRKEFITGMMDCDSAEMICGPPSAESDKVEVRGSQYLRPPHG